MRQDHSRQGLPVGRARPHLEDLGQFVAASPWRREGVQLGTDDRRRHRRGVRIAARLKQLFAALSYESVPSSRTAADAARPSPRPTNPKRSVVVALMLMHPAAIPRSAARFSAIVARCAAIRGASANTVTSALTTRNPAARMIAATSRKN